MKLTKEQVEMIKNDSETTSMKHGYDMTIIELCTDWLKMNNDYAEEAHYMKIHHKRIMGQFCAGCKWWVYDNEMEEYECKNKDVLFYVQGEENYKGFRPWASFGCNQWEVKDE